MIYHIVFDIAIAGYRAWGLPLLPLALCLLAAWRGQSWTVPPLPAGRATRRFLVRFCLFGALISAALSYANYRSLLRDREDGRVRVLQGVVTDFHPGDLLTHKIETFRVDGEQVAYSAFDVSGGYNRVAGVGGVVRAGCRVRVTLVGNEIVKLEIAG